MELHEIVAQVEPFGRWNHTEKIKFFAWCLHHHKGITHFSAADITKCFSDLHLAPPSSVHSLLSSLVNRSPKILLKSAKGYSLERAPLDDFSKRYGDRAATVHVDKLLSELPGRLPNLAERAYLDEALQCFRIKAYRASIVMTWNLAYDHLCEWVLAGHLPAFNAQLPRTTQKPNIALITKKDDFADHKEHTVLTVCKSAAIISNSLHKVMQEKLTRRNVAAHPSGVQIFQLTAEDFIKDLVENVVIKLT